MIQFKINTISGTVCPARKNLKDNDFESLFEGANYFLENGITNICAQPKYMGSHCQVYLFPKEIDKSYMVSRNGFIIKNVKFEDRMDIYTELCSRLESFIKTNKTF